MVWRPRTEIGRRIKQFVRTDSRPSRRTKYAWIISGVSSIIIDDESTVVITSKDKKVWDYPIDIVIECNSSKLPITVSHSGIETIIEVPSSQRMRIKEQYNKLRIIDVY